MTLKFIDKLDSLIFGHFNPAHEPVTGATVAVTFLAGLGISLVMFICQMCGMSDNILEIILGIAVIALLGFIGFMTYPAVLAFGSWSARIGYSLYSILLFGIALYLSIWAFMLALVALVLYVMLKFFFSNGNSKKATIRYSDGSEEEADVETGLLGEKYYHGKKSGNTYYEP